jgi:hypothetical protein
MMNMIDNGYVQNLSDLKETLEELELTATLYPQSDEIAMDILSVQLDTDEKGRENFITLTLYPLSEDLSGSTFLQIFSQFPYKVVPKGVKTLAHLFLPITNKIPLGHFGLDDAQTSVIFKYVLALPLGYKATAPYLNDVMNMCVFVGVLFRDLLEAMAEGELSSEEALEELNAIPI